MYYHIMEEASGAIVEHCSDLAETIEDAKQLGGKHGVAVLCGVKLLSSIQGSKRIIKQTEKITNKHLLTFNTYYYVKL